MRAVIARVAAFAAALGTLPLLALVLVRGVDVPYLDEWRWTNLIYAEHIHTLAFAHLWTPHFEHRLLLPELIVLGLDAVGGWSVVREQVVSLVFVALTQLALWLLISRTISAERAPWCFVATTILLLGLVQYENFQSGFQMPWFICNLGLFVVVWTLTRSQPGALEIVVAAGVAVLASLSMSQGLFVWPAGLAAILFAAQPRASVTIAWSILAVLCAAAVRAGAISQAVAGHAALIHLRALGMFVLLFLGGPLAHRYAVIAAVVGLAAFATICFLALRARALRTRLAPWIAIGSYALLSAGVAATSRVGLGVDQALESRYSTIATVWWIAVLAGAFVALPRARRSAVALAAASAAVLSASALETAWGNDRWERHVALMHDAQAAIVAGDSSRLGRIYVSRTEIERYLSELAAIHDGVFSR